MKLLYALTVFALVESAFGQQCPGVLAFGAVTFDVLNFSPSYSWHDTGNGLTLYENTNNDGGFLYDFNAGIIYVRIDNDTCHKYQTDDFKVMNRDASLPALTITPVFSYIDDVGVSHTGLQFTAGNLLLKNLFNGDCFGEFISFAFSGKIKWAYYYTDPKAMTTEESAKVQAALAQYQADNCETRSI